MVVATGLVPVQVTQIIHAQRDLFSKEYTLGEVNGLALTESV